MCARVESNAQHVVVVIIVVVVVVVAQISLPVRTRSLHGHQSINQWPPPLPAADHHHQQHNKK